MAHSLVNAAIGAALASPGVGKRRGIRVGAVIAYGKHPIAAGFNSYKTHPFVARHCKWPYLHAEVAAVLAAGLDRCRGSVLVSARVLRNGSLANSKPCDDCLRIIRMAGIKTVIYTSDNGNTERLKP